MCHMSAFLIQRYKQYLRVTNFCTAKIAQHNIRGSSKAKTAVRILNGALINKAG